MTEGFIETTAQRRAPAGHRVYGVAQATVISNRDLTGGARVQLKLPWLPGIEPWARVAVAQAGGDHGTFFIPQDGDEVLVAFSHGDVREPYVIGSLWNGEDKPPRKSPIDPAMKRLIKSPAGHEIELDDTARSITIKSATDQKVTIDPQQIEITTANGTATVTMTTAGKITIKASVSLELKAPMIKLEGDVVQVKSSAATKIDGGGACTISAGVVKIN